MTEKLDAKYDRQFAAWGLDRAIRMAEVDKTIPCTIESLTALAQQLCEWIQPEGDGLPDLDPTEAELLKQDTANHAMANGEMQ